MMRNPIAHFAERIKASYEPGEDDPWWYDNTGHFLGGVVIGLITFGVFGFGLIGSMLAFLLTAALWEAFERIHNIRPWDPRENWSYDRAVEDTLLDTYVGLTGMILVWWLL